MSDTKLLQSILDKVSSVDRKVDRGFKDIKVEVLNNRKRIDKLGLDLVELSDDAPTIGEFDKLEKRVTKLEHRVAKN